MDVIDRAWRRLAELARISESPEGITRTFGSAAWDEAGMVLAQWMREAGLHVERDGWGNLFGCSRQGCGEVVVMGSHFDTVRRGGAFDGALGILAALAAVELLGRERLDALPFGIEVAAFSEEEGVRFPATYLGSRAALGLITKQDLESRDAEGVCLGSLIAPEHQSPKNRYGGGRAKRYLEVHIEQGPVLERQGAALGVVSAIAGQCRIRAALTGRAGHAGTCPMDLRKDALAGAAEAVLAAEALARGTDGLVATVGCLEVDHAAPNVIPGRVEWSLDVRHAVLERLEQAERQLTGGVREIACRRGLELAWERVFFSAPVPAAAEVVAELRAAVDAIQGNSPVLVSGAGHDAAVFGSLVPMGMIFVRCKGGVSHNPAESVAEEDFGFAVEALVKVLEGGA